MRAIQTIHGAIKALVSGPTEPITVAEAKTHLRVDGASEDIYIGALITAAREYVERVTGRALGTQTWDVWFDDFADEMELPRPPLASVTSITYTDVDGNSQTATGSLYTVDTAQVPGRVYLAYNQTWPSTQSIRKAVKIRYVAGSSTPPKTLEQAMLLLVATWYENRESVIVGTNAMTIPHAVDMLLAPYKVF